MRTSAGGCWLAVGLLCGCGPAPSEVIGPYDGTGGSSGSATGGPSSGEVGTGSTGPIADGSAGSGTGMPTTMSGDTGTTAPVDPVTTDPDTASGDVPTTTDPSSGDPGSSSSGDPPPLTCDQIFGTADGYLLCMEDETSCTFALNTGNNNCNVVCSSFGEVCLGAIDNPTGVTCDQQGASSCDVTKGSTICICSK